MNSRLGANLLVEFIGTFALVFCGILVFNYGKSAALADKVTSLSALITIALGHGLILSTMVTAAMPTSGGQFNPAVTAGFLLTGKMKPVEAISYIVIQLLAGVVAALAVFVVHGASNDAGKMVLIGVTDYSSVNSVNAILVEAIATFFLVFAVWGSAVDGRAKNVGGFAIGLTVAADILAFGPITNASMNPARSFGPTLVASMVPGGQADWLWSHQWVYWVGPLLGGVVAAGIYKTLLLPKQP